MINFKIGIVAGHGGSDLGGGTNEHFKEKDMNLKISRAMNFRLKELGFETVMIRREDAYMSLQQRAKIAKDNEVDLLISNHINNVSTSEAKGAEVIHSIKSDGKLANMVYNNLIAAGASKRRVFSKESDMYPNLDWYGIIRRSYPIETIIIEYGFASNKGDTEKILSDWNKYVEAVCKAVTSYTNSKYVPSELNGKVAIMGNSQATKEQMIGFLLNNNPKPKINCTVEELVTYFIEEAAFEGVRHDGAFVQCCKETGYFNYGGIVTPEMNNFAGLGALNGNKKGNAAYFKTPRLGVRAVIQHLKGYASTDIPIYDIIDPRYEVLINKKLLGTALYFEDLGGKWAWPGYDKGKYKSLKAAYEAKDTYGHSIVKMLNKLLEVPIKTDIASSDYQKMYEELLITHMDLNEEHLKLSELHKNVKKQIEDIIDLIKKWEVV